MEEIVHIIPLGFEIDRAIVPFEKMRANRVHILYSKEYRNPDRNPQHFFDSVKKVLKSKNINVVEWEINIFELLPVLSKISSIIVQEKKEKNIIYVNMCAAGKLTSVASTLAAMYHDVKVYYVRADGYPTNEEEIQKHGLSIVNNVDYTILTNFNIDMPSGAKAVFLTELYKKGEMTTYDISKLIKDKKLKGFEDLNEKLKNGKERSASNFLVRINRGLLDDLKRNGYIDIEKKGNKKIIKITVKGSYAACLIGPS